MPTGRLTRDDLLRAWRDAVDPDFARGVLEGGEGAEVPGQLCEQLAIVSAAAEEASEELRLLPYSGQSGAPASGARRSTVLLDVARTAGFDRLLVLEAGQLFEEVAVDATPGGALLVGTGRRYGLDERLVLFPGAAAASARAASAEKRGRAYDYPTAGSISRPWTPGAGLRNDGASVEPGTAGPHRLRSAPRPDAPVPEAVGRTLVFRAGANEGSRVRVVGYEPPLPGDAGSYLLARDALVRTAALDPALLIGEELLVAATGARARLLAAAEDPGGGAARALFELLGGPPLAPGDAAVGLRSGATLVVGSVELGGALAAETGTAAWEVEDPALLFGLASSNPAAPAGGRDGTLDSIAWSRMLARGPGEGDEELRERVADPAPTVSPVAVLRAVNRALAPFGQEASLLEAGDRERGLPGFALDADFLDLESLAVNGSVTGAFQSGEPVVQPDTGASGVALCAPSLGGGPEAIVAVSRPRGAFLAGRDVIGLRSGAVLSAPAISGGLRPSDAQRTLDTFADVRGFFVLGVPHRGVGDFGFFFDAGDAGFYDSAPALSFFDGFAATSAVVAARAWHAADEARAAGVGHDLLPP